MGRSFNWESDLEYAEQVCSRHSDALEYFQKDFLKYFLWRARSLEPWSDKEKYKYWIVKTEENNYKINIPEETMNAFSFVSEYAIKQTCKYKGISGSSLKTYIKTIVNGKFCRYAYIREKKGDINYVPKCVQETGEQYEKLLISLRKNENMDSICDSLEIDEKEYQEYVSKLYNCLSKNNLLNLIDNVDVDIEPDDFQNIADTETSTVNIKGYTFRSNVSRDTYLEQIKILLNSILELLPSDELDLLIQYWGSGLKVNQIFNAWSNKDVFREKLEKLNINKPNDIYNKIRRITNTCVQKLKDDSEMLMDEELTDNQFKALIKIYVQNFYNNDEKNIFFRA